MRETDQDREYQVGQTYNFFAPVAPRFGTEVVELKGRLEAKLIGDETIFYLERPDTKESVAVKREVLDYLNPVKKGVEISDSGILQAPHEIPEIGTTVVAMVLRRDLPNSDVYQHDLRRLVAVPSQYKNPNAPKENQIRPSVELFWQNPYSSHVRSRFEDVCEWGPFDKDRLYIPED